MKKSRNREQTMPIEKPSSNGAIYHTTGKGRVKIKISTISKMIKPVTISLFKSASGKTTRWATRASRNPAMIHGWSEGDSASSSITVFSSCLSGMILTGMALFLQIRLSFFPASWIHWVLL